MVHTRGNANQENETESDTLETLIESWKNEILEKMQVSTDIISAASNEVTQLRLDIINIAKTSNEALALAKKNESDIAYIQSSLQTLHSTTKELGNNVDSLTAQKAELAIRLATVEYANTELSEQLEEARNRQMRKTLIFKGIDELENESWDDTAELVAEKISSASEGNLSFDDALDSIERAHRSGGSGEGKKDRRDITAAFYDWQTSEKVKNYFMRKNSKDRSFKVFCEQKYGPTTTARRNIAMKERRSLLNKNEIAKAYVAYPAKLMVATDKKDKRYRLHSDYSETPVQSKRRDDAPHSSGVVVM